MIDKNEKNVVNSPDDEFTRSFFKDVRVALGRFGFLGSLSRFIMMKDEYRKFVKEAASIEEKSFRKILLKNFSNIHSNIPCPHFPFQFVLMAK